MSTLVTPPQVLGYEVVEPKMVKGVEHFIKLSRRFLVEDAAQTACSLLRQHGHPNAYVRKAIGSEGIRGGKRFMAKSGAL